MTLPRWWGAVPLALIAGLFALRAALHTPALDALAPVASDPRDPPGTTARAGSIAIERGGPVLIGFQSDTEARLQFAGAEIRGRGVVKQRVIVLHGAAPIRFAGPPDARLMWSPVGRRGDPEYVSASSLSPEPPDRATFDAPGTARLDGAIALAMLVIVVAALCTLARRRLAAVPRATWIAMGATIVVALAVRLMGQGDQGQTWDEDVNWAAARNYVTNVLALDFADRSWIWNYEHPPVMKLLDGIGAQLSSEMGPARTLSALWSALGCALLVPIGVRLARLRVGLVAGLVAALLPPLVAHGQVVGHEAPTVLWWALGILLALGVHDGLPEAPDAASRRTLAYRLCWLGAAVGIAVASRFVNGLLGVLVVAIVAIRVPRPWWRATAIRAALTPLTSVATVIAVWPRLWGHPIAALEQSLKRLSQSHALEPYLGQITNEPGWHYFLVYLAATLPLGVALAVVAGLVRSAADRGRAALIVALWFLVPLLVMFSPVRQDGVRYVMPCILALAMLAALGVDALARLARWKHAFPALAAALLLYQGVVLARTAPYYLDYFGEHTGGAGAVARRRAFETGWWGEGLDRALDVVNVFARRGALVHRCIFGPGHLAWFREDLWTVPTDLRQAEWIVDYSPATRTFPCPIPRDATLVYENVHDGVTLAAVYYRVPTSSAWPSAAPLPPAPAGR
ncbi:MAG: glycosyltransferase family 39 protein [Deltaproteobacteria bacterium]|nr:glycosyltransferase family 39 protein [Deltaproteobacteria bacterium]